MHDWQRNECSDGQYIVFTRRLIFTQAANGTMKELMPEYVAAPFAMLNPTCVPA
jgi:hypothetical protein